MKTKSTFILITFFIYFFPVASKMKGSEAYSQSPGWQWAKSSGSPVEDDVMNTMVIDSAGNVYTSGRFWGTVDFDPDPLGTNLLTSAGLSDIFISKFDRLGNIIWVKQIGDSTYDYAYSLALDDSGHLYSCGVFGGTVDFDPDSVGYFSLTATGYDDIFISKLDTAGNFIWAKRMGGPSSEFARSIAVDPHGDVYIGGNFYGTADFDPDSLADFHLNSFGYADIFIAKLNASGDFVWARRMGSSLYEFCNGIAVDSSCNVYAVGKFDGIVDFDPDSLGVFNLTSVGYADIYISKLDRSGNFVWARSMGGTVDDLAEALALDASKNVYVTGYFQRTVDFDPGPGIFNLTSQVDGCSFILKLDSSGNFTWAKSLVSARANGGRAIAIDASGNIYTTGMFSGTVDCDPGAGVYHFTVTGTLSSDVYLFKLDPSGNFVWAQGMGGDRNDEVLTLALDRAEHVHVGGFYYSPSIGIGSDTLTNAGASLGTADFFFAKLESCYANFTIQPDTIPYSWAVLNQASAIAPVTYLWDWGDTSSSPGTAPTHVYADSGFYTICLSINDAAGCINTYCDTLTVLFPYPSSIQETDVNQMEITVYPNPATSEFAIYSSRSAIHSIEIISLAGVLIFKKALQNGIQEEKIEVSMLPSGLYFVKVITDQNVATLKVVKE